MDKELDEYTVDGGCVTTYLDQCQELLEGYLAQLPEIESLQEIIDLNTGLATGFLDALNEMIEGEVTKH